LFFLTMVKSHLLWVLLLLLLRSGGGGGGSAPPQPRLLIVVITKTTEDEISPSLHNRINVINSNSLSDENLMMAGIGRNM